MSKAESQNKFGLPESFKPLLWSFRWEAMDPEKNKDDIIVNTVNEGTLAHWRWIVERYGRETIREVLAKRLISEFHPESLNLAKVFFNLPPLRYAR